MPDRRALHDIISAIADGDPVEWATAAAGARTSGERDLVLRLHSIANVADRRQAPNAWVDATAAPRPYLAFGILVIVAAVKIALALVAGCVLLAGDSVPDTAVWPHVVNLVVFGIGGTALTVGGKRDLRSRRLGMFFFVTASTFTDRLLSQFGGDAMLSIPVAIVTRIGTDAFLAFALWLFVWEFPSPSRRRADRLLNQRILRISAAVGTVLFVACAVPMLAIFGVTVPPIVTEASALLDRRSPTSHYWPVVFCMLAPALPYLVWKSRFESAGERGRVGTFVISLVVGLTPVSLAVILTPFFRFFDDPANREGIGLFLYGSLLSIVPMTAYSVLVNRVMDIELIITAAMRYSVIRYSVWMAGVAPLGAMASYVYANRHLTVTQILSAREAVLLLPLAGVVALTFRSQIFHALDRRLIGERPDYMQVLAYLERALREAQGVRNVIAILTRELERALHAHATEVLVLDEKGSALVSTTNAVRALPLDSTLGNLIRLTREEIYAGVEASGPVGHLLPAEDRRWLTDHRFQVLMPLTASGGDLLGVIALGEKRSGSGFSAEDRLLLAMMANNGAVILENRSLRDLPYRHLVHPSGRSWGHIDWDDEPGALCQKCRLVSPARNVTCECGSATVPAALPLLFRGKFRIERLLGSGGMSVVYLATDIALNRRVAIKTLPALTPDRVLRLEREARAMASILHPNLAMILSIESWRGAPLLVVEYLERGTLADWLATERLSVADAVDLGVVMADVLDQVHAADVLHRDIKPSNIGYARNGAPKLMDFGIVHVLPVAVPRATATLTHAAESVAASAAAVGAASTNTGPALLGTSPDHVIGTPLYLSPEAVNGAEPDGSFDLWSLNVTLYEAMSGVHPFHGETAEEVFENISRANAPDIRARVPDCPPDLAGLLADALAGDAARRPATAADLRNRLGRIRAELQRR